jgi:hypothetical protein
MLHWTKAGYSGHPNEWKSISFDTIVMNLRHQNKMTFPTLPT